MNKCYEGASEYDKWTRWILDPVSVSEDQVRETHQANPGTDRSLETEVMWTTAHGLPY